MLQKVHIEVRRDLWSNVEMNSSFHSWNQNDNENFLTLILASVGKSSLIVKFLLPQNNDLIQSKINRSEYVSDGHKKSVENFKS